MYMYKPGLSTCETVCIMLKGIGNELNVTNYVLNYYRCYNDEDGNNENADELPGGKKVDVICPAQSNPQKPPRMHLANDFIHHYTHFVSISKNTNIKSF